MAVGCLTRAQILKGYKGEIVNNSDGSLTVYLPNLTTGVQTPTLLTKPCCEALNTVDNPTYFDVNTQQCKYVNNITSSAINIVLNPKGSDGEWFSVTPNETCTLSIDFDYLFKFTCDDLAPLVSTTNGVINMIENLSASMSIDTKTNSTNHIKILDEVVFSAIGTGNAYTYFSGATTNSGFYICGGLVGDNSDCNPLNLYTLTHNGGILNCSDAQHQLINGLFNESGLPTTGLTAFKAAINENCFSSNWLHYHIDITDPAILSGITNEKIVLTLRVSGVTTDISVLLDNIQLNKTCTEIESNNIFVTQSPGFELDRIKDNKKSWATKTSIDNRKYHIGRFDESVQIRETNYMVNYDDRQVINSKEIDLDIDIASAIETDVWNYISNNPCILTGVTVGTTTCTDKITQENYCCSNSCGDKPIDINDLLTQPLSAITTIEDFEYFLTSELIDVKNRQSISSYPTLRLLYDRYMNSLNHCGTSSAAFDYFTMDKFSKLIGNYWIDLVEQVIPATTIWGSTKIYTNTIFDNQKYKYKAYTSLFGVNTNTGKVLSPVSGSYATDIITTVIKGQSSDTLEFFNEGNIHEYNNIYLLQMNSSPEYIGYVHSMNAQTPQVIAECTLKATIPTYTSPDIGLTNGTATAVPVGAQSPVTYLWSNGQTTQTAINLSGGTYSVIISDNICSDIATIVITACTIGIDFNTINPNYLSDNGSITATTTNAQGPVTYLWSNGKTTNILTGLTSNTYTLTVTDTMCSYTENVTLNDITNFAWRASGTTCEKEPEFGVRKIISGLSSPMGLFYDTGFTTPRVWVADNDNYLKGNLYWFDPVTATTEADMHYIAGLSADSLYSVYMDEIYRRIYFVGYNSIGATPVTGLVVYDIPSGTFYQKPYGANDAYRREILFVNDINIYVGYIYGTTHNMYIFNRAGLSSTSPIPTPISDTKISTDTNFGQVGDKIWAIYYDSKASIKIFDNDLNPLNININSISVSAYTLTYNNSPISIFYDKDYNTVYLGDITGEYKYIISGVSASNNYTAGTLTSYSMDSYRISGSTSVGNDYQIDPISNKLYQIQTYNNPARYASYEVDRSTYETKRMYDFSVHHLKQVNDGLPDTLMACSWGNWSWQGGSWNTDGKITFYNNTISSATTGTVIITSTTKYDTYTNKSYVPLTVSANTGDASVIPASYYTTSGSCAIIYNLDCPLIKWTSGTPPTVEMYINKSTATNPAISKILVQGYWDTTPKSTYTLLSGSTGFNQYNKFTLTGGTAYAANSINVTYYSGGPVTYSQIGTCTRYITDFGE